MQNSAFKCLLASRPDLLAQIHPILWPTRRSKTHRSAPLPPRRRAGPRAYVTASAQGRGQAAPRGYIDGGWGRRSITDGPTPSGVELPRPVDMAFRFVVSWRNVFGLRGICVECSEQNQKLISVNNYSRLFRTIFPMLVIYRTNKVIEWLIFIFYILQALKFSCFLLP